MRSCARGLNMLHLYQLFFSSSSQLHNITIFHIPSANYQLKKSMSYIVRVNNISLLRILC